MKSLQSYSEENDIAEQILRKDIEINPIRHWDLSTETTESEKRFDFFKFQIWSIKLKFRILMLRKFWRLMKCNVTRTRPIAEVDAVDYYYKSIR